MSCLEKNAHLRQQALEGLCQRLAEYKANASENQLTLLRQQKRRQDLQTAMAGLLSCPAGQIIGSCMMGSPLSLLEASAYSC